MIALIGAGAWGKNLLRNLHELGVLHSVVDPSPAARRLAAELQVPCYDDRESVLGDAAVTGAVIATPAQTHCEVALAAIAAGKDVFVEKPIALTPEDARRMAAAAESAGRVLMVGHLLQYHPVFEALRSLVERGELGSVRYISCARLNFGRIRSNENVIWSFSPHDISMVLSLVPSAVADVAASGHAILQAGIEDIGRIELTFENGAYAEIRSSWLNPFKEQKLVVVGDTAMAVFDDREPWERKLAIFENAVELSDTGPTAKAGPVRYVAVQHREPLKSEMQHFVDRIADRRAPRTDAAEATAVLEVLQRSSDCIARSRT